MSRQNLPRFSSLVARIHREGRSRNPINPRSASLQSALNPINSFRALLFLDGAGEWRFVATSLITGARARFRGNYARTPSDYVMIIIQRVPACIKPQKKKNVGMGKKEQP